MNTAEKLLESWKKEQRHLEQFQELWKNHYLLNLRERSQLLNKHPRVVSVKEPRIGDIVQVKDSSPRGTWRIGRVIEILKAKTETTSNKRNDTQQEHLTKVFHTPVYFRM